MTPLADRIRALSPAERDELFASLPPGALTAACEHVEFWARPAQAFPSPGDLWPFELITGGFAAGKTWWAVQLWTREYLAGRVRYGALVGATLADVVSILIRGESGIWPWLPYRWRAKCGHDVENTFTRSKDGGTFQLPGLPPVTCLSVEKPGRAIGHGKDLVLWDDPAKCVEVCGERRTREMFLALRKSRRAGPNPSVLIPTTPNGIPFMRRAFSGNLSGVRKRNLGSARDNTANPASYVADIAEMSAEGEDLAGLDGVEREDTPGALWRRAWITERRVIAAPDLRRVVVAVDPADDGRQDSDETGIVVVGEGHDDRLYVLADYTARWTAEHWPAICAWAFREYKADGIVAEMNRARSLVRRCIAIEAPNVPVIEVDATRGKATRAEPLSMLYRDGHVSHVVDGPQMSSPRPIQIEVSYFNPKSDRREPLDLEVHRNAARWQTLEDELCGWVPRQSRSPNGLDALVWGAWHLRPPDGGGEVWSPSAPTATTRFAGADPRAPAAVPSHVDPRRPSPRAGLLRR